MTNPQAWALLIANGLAARPFAFLKPPPVNRFIIEPQPFQGKRAESVMLANLVKVGDKYAEIGVFPRQPGTA
jgi:hypothetical protein